MTLPRTVTLGGVYDGGGTCTVSMCVSKPKTVAEAKRARERDALQLPV